MLIAHLPAGYLLASTIAPKMERFGLSRAFTILVFLIVSVLPDLDLLYFYFIDGRQNSHHTYWTHLPFFWFSVFIITSVIAFVFKNKKIFGVACIMILGVLLHLFLDTMVGSIYWLYPLNDIAYTFVTIKPKYDWWVLNFVFHWSFLIELVIFLSACVLFKFKSGIHVNYVHAKKIDC